MLSVVSADTWEFKTISFAGDTSGAFNNDNGWSANLEFMLNAGTNFTSGDTLTSYASHSNTNGTRAGGTTLALGANIGETIQFTGVQLEVGTQASDFEHRSFGEELALCQRYFAKTFQYADAPAYNAGSPNAISGPAASNTAYDNILQWWLTVKLRASPTVTLYNPYASNTNFGMSGSDGPAAGTYSIGENNVSIRDNGGGAGGTNLQIHATADAEL